MTMTAEQISAICTIPFGYGYVPHSPHVKQHVFLTLNDEEAFYGGAAGGGKSDALLMAALQYVDVPGYAAILFRRTYTDLSLPGALMDRASQWLSPTKAKWDGTEKTWRFPSGATLTFGYLATSNDKYRYQSAEFQFIGFDELTQFPETDYTYLFSRLRRTMDITVPLRMRAASNPGNEGHEWVKERFITAATREDRIFVPSKISDNPSLDQAEYARMLSRLDPATRAQLLEGDWDIREPTGREFFAHDDLERLALFVRDAKRVGHFVGDPAPGGKVSWSANPQGPTRIWREPQAGHTYAIFGDVAGGISEVQEDARPRDAKRDSCGAYVVDLTNGELVCEHHELTNEPAYAATLARIGYIYSTAEIAVEVQGGHGNVTVYDLRDKWAYPRLYHREGLLKDARGEFTHELGWSTNATTRPQMLAELNRVLEDDPSRLPSRELLAQMRWFVWNKLGTKAEADVGSHDDLVMGAAGACRLYQLRAQRPVNFKTPKRKTPERRGTSARAPRIAA